MIPLYFCFSQERKVHNNFLKKQLRNLEYTTFQNLLVKLCVDHKAILVRELQFCKGRQWRFDYVIFTAENKIAIEIEGGVFTGGGHIRTLGFLKDIQKYNTATTLGFNLLRISGTDARNIEKILLFIVNFLEKML